MDAVKRLERKLEKMRGTGETIDMASELRHLTLQVIGQAIMNLPPDERDSVRYLSLAWTVSLCVDPCPDLFAYHGGVQQESHSPGGGYTCLLCHGFNSISD